MKNTSRRASLCRKSDMRYPIRDKRSELAVNCYCHDRWTGKITLPREIGLSTALSSVMSPSKVQL